MVFVLVFTFNEPCTQNKTFYRVMKILCLFRSIFACTCTCTCKMGSCNQMYRITGSSHVSVLYRKRLLYAWGKFIVQYIHTKKRLLMSLKNCNFRQKLAEMKVFHVNNVFKKTLQATLPKSKSHKLNIA